MAITINGTGTITGISAGGLPDGSVTAADIESSLDLTGKTVTLPSGTGGKVLQVQYNSTGSTGQQTHTANTDTPHSYLTVDITPVSQTSIIYVSYHLYGEWSAAGAYDGTALLSRRVGGTHNYLKAPAGLSNQRRGLTISQHLSFYSNDADSTPKVIALMQYPDDHNETNQITYFPAINPNVGWTWYYNRTAGNANSVYHERGVSWIMAMEVEG